MNQQELIEKLNDATGLEFREHYISGELIAIGEKFSYEVHNGKNNFHITWWVRDYDNVTHNVSLDEVIKIINNKEIV